MSIAVLVSAASDDRARTALERASARIPTSPLRVADADRLAALRRTAATPGIDWIVWADADAVPEADAFARLRRSLASAPALLGGRAVIAGSTHYGAMFAPARSGPQPFEIATISGLTEEPGLAAILRGAIDIPQRGLIVVSTAFLRSLPPDVALDPLTLHLDLAVQARAGGQAVLCEPSMSFASEDETPPVRRRMLDLQRFAMAGTWSAERLHREPPALRSHLIDRDTRVMGNFRGYLKRAVPTIETVTYAPRDAAAVRAALARTGDRYVLLVAAGTNVTRASVERLIESLERSNRYALATERDAPPYGAVLVHAGRLPAGGRLRGDTVQAIIADAVATLPEFRLYAAGLAGPIVPATLPPLPGIGALDVVFVAAAQPIVTGQTLQALLQECGDARVTAVYAAGAETTRRLLASYPGVHLVADDADPTLAVGLNRVLATCRGDAVAIVRDDAQATRGMIGRLRAAFARVARLGVAVPRIGGGDRPEGLPDVSYASAVDMASFAERRAASFAREAMLVDVATTPAIVVARTVLDIVGGFDESFGFSRFGIEDFTRRVRAANFNVARCDDAYVHLFPTEHVESLLAPLDTSSTLFARYYRRWEEPRGFDPAADIVPLRGATIDGGRPEPARLRVLVPVGTAEEWRTLEPALATFAQTFRAGDPVDVAIGLDGSFSLGAAVAAVRELLLGVAVPMDETLNVHIEPVADLTTWRNACERSVRLTGAERAALHDLIAVDDATALRAHVLEPSA